MSGTVFEITSAERRMFENRSKSLYLQIVLITKTDNYDNEIDEKE